MAGTICYQDLPLTLSLNFTTTLHVFILSILHSDAFPSLRLLFWFVIGLFRGHHTK